MSQARGSLFGEVASAAAAGTAPVREPASESHPAAIVLWGLCIFLLTSPFTFVLIGQNPAVSIVRNLATMRQADNSQWMLYAVRFGVLALAAAFAVPRWRVLARTWPQLLPIMPFVLWAALSIAWSDDATTTFHSVISLVSLVLASYLIAAVLPARDLVPAVVIAAGAMAVCSIGNAALLPAYGIHQANDASQYVHAGNWRGVYMHKNFLGQVAAMFGAAIFWPRLDGAWRWARWSVFALLIVLIALSTSATALAIIPIALVLEWAALMAGSRARAQVLVFALPALLLGYMLVDVFLNALGRDATFSGRTVVWSVATQSFLDHPIAGLGFVSLTYGDFSYQLMRLTGLFDPHNAFFDIVLGTGAVGLVLFAGAVVAAWRVGRRLYVGGGGERQASLVLFGLLVAWLIGGMTEATDRPFSAMGGLGLFALSALLSLPRGAAGPAPRRGKESPAMALMRATADRTGF